ncbi:MAG: lysophospholipid acyltransferase family protein [bacterium]
MRLITKILHIIIWLVLRPFLKVFTDFQISYPDNFSFKTPVIVVANHMGLMDPFLVGVSFPLFSKIHPFSFMTADSWINRSILGIFVKLLGGFPTYYGQGLEISLKKPQEIIKNNGSIVIFPQGKRIWNISASQGKIGAAVLALKTRTSIIPCRIIDTYPNSVIKIFLRKRKFKIIIGQPFSLTEKFGKKNIYTKNEYIQATKIIMQKIKELS